MGRERTDGKVYLVGGVIVFPGRSLPRRLTIQTYAWRANRFLSPLREDRAALHELHSQIPHFHKMLASVERTMVRFAPDRPFERCSWWVADDRELFWRAFPFSLALVFVLTGRACDR